jgi:type IV pilus assembly protein PilQ
MLILLRIFIACLLAVAAPCTALHAESSLESASGEVMLDEISVRDKDIADVLSLISQKSGLNIVAGKSVTGKVTIFLKKVKAREALRTLVEMNDLAFVDEGGIIRIMTAAEYAARYGQTFGQDRVTRVIKLHYVLLKELLPLLLELKSGDGKVIPNEEARSVAVMDTPEKVKAMEALIREVDLQTGTATLTLQNVRAGDICDEVRALANPSVGSVECDTVGDRIQVTDTLAGLEKLRRAVAALDARGLNILLEARLVHIVLNEEHLNGVDWAGIVSDVRDVRLEGAYSFMNSGSRGALLSLGVVADEDLSPLVEALDTVGIVKEYPETDIMVTPDVAAKLTMRFDAPDLALSAASMNGADEEEDEPASPSALTLLVKPVVSADGSIITSVMPQETARVLKGAVRVPRGETVALADGNSLVLGSVISTRNEATVQKIPLMGDIPLLGLAFRYHKSSIRREEFIVFLTPKVVKASGTPIASDKDKDKPQVGPASGLLSVDTVKDEVPLAQGNDPLPLVDPKTAVAEPSTPLPTAPVMQNNETVTK